MQDRKTIKEFLTPEGKWIVIKVYYEIGGPNYFSGTVNQRGYYLSVIPEERTEKMRVYGFFTGVKQFMEPANRFSRSRLETLQPKPEDVEKLLDHVLQKNKLTLPDGISFAGVL